MGQSCLYFGDGWGLSTSSRRCCNVLWVCCGQFHPVIYRVSTLRVKNRLNQLIQKASYFGVGVCGVRVSDLSFREENVVQDKDNIWQSLKFSCWSGIEAHSVKTHSSMLYHCQCSSILSCQVTVTPSFLLLLIIIIFVLVIWSTEAQQFQFQGINKAFWFALAITNNWLIPVVIQFPCWTPKKIEKWRKHNKQ